MHALVRRRASARFLQPALRHVLHDLAELIQFVQRRVEARRDLTPLDSAYTIVYLHQFWVTRSVRLCRLMCVAARPHGQRKYFVSFCGYAPQRRCSRKKLWAGGSVGRSPHRTSGGTAAENKGLTTCVDLFAHTPPPASQPASTSIAARVITFSEFTRLRYDHYSCRGFSGRFVM